MLGKEEERYFGKNQGGKKFEKNSPFAGTKKKRQKLGTGCTSFLQGGGKGKVLVEKRGGLFQNNACGLGGPKSVVKKKKRVCANHFKNGVFARCQEKENRDLGEGRGFNKKKWSSGEQLRCNDQV